MNLQVGDTLGSYRVISTLGIGGGGEVFEVEHLITRRVEAMKVLLSGLAGNSTRAERFCREIQIQASLNHPNIAAVYNAFDAGDALVMVMEMVDGVSLAQLQLERVIDLETAFGYIHQVLSALKYAHERAIIHRDVTPSNILVTRDGTVKLTDFGIARLETGSHLTQQGVVMGSCHYMSPEQVRGLSNVDARSDLYSAGTVLYELVTGRRPFEAPDAFSLMAAHVSQNPRLPSELNPGLPPALNGVILTALAKDPEMRFQSADAFLRALEAAVTGTRPPAGAIRPVRRTRVTAMAIALLSASAAGAWLWFKTPEPPPPPVVTRAPPPAPETKPSPMKKTPVKPSKSAAVRPVEIKPVVKPKENVFKRFGRVLLFRKKRPEKAGADPK